MNTKFDVRPLEKFLTEVISPEDFTGLIDTFIFNFCLMNVRLQVIDEEGGFIPDNNTLSFFFNLKGLKDALLECKKMNIEPEQAE